MRPAVSLIISRSNPVHAVNKSEKSKSTDLGETFSALQSNLRHYLGSRVDESDLEDLLQDIFVKALNAINNEKSPRNLPAWLYAVARTTVVDYYRAKKANSVIRKDSYPDKVNIEDDLLEQQLANCLKPLALELPEIYRDTLLATEFEGKKMRELSQKTGLSLSAIKSRASRARAMLKDKLFECCNIEIANGEVIDYQQNKKVFCHDDCSNNCA